MWHACGVGDEGAVDAFGDLSFEQSKGFGTTVAGLDPSAVVVASWPWDDGLDVCCEVDRFVELAVAASGEPVADDNAAGRFDGCGAGVAGDVVGARESADVRRFGSDPTLAGRSRFLSAASLSRFWPANRAGPPHWVVDAVIDTHPCRFSMIVNVALRISVIAHID